MIIVHLKRKLHQNSIILIKIHRICIQKGMKEEALEAGREAELRLQARMAKANEEVREMRKGGKKKHGYYDLDTSDHKQMTTSESESIPVRPTPS